MAWLSSSYLERALLHTVFDLCSLSQAPPWFRVPGREYNKGDSWIFNPLQKNADIFTSKLLIVYEDVDLISPKGLHEMADEVVAQLLSSEINKNLVLLRRRSLAFHFEGTTRNRNN